MAMGSKAFESPLISHVRMRALYRGLVEVRAMLGKRHSARGLEAVWVATAIDLEEGDLTSDGGKPGEAIMLEHVRAVGRRAEAGAPKAADVRRLTKELAGAKPERFPGSAADRLLCAIGAAMAIRAAGEQRVMVAYAGRAEIEAGEWKRVLAILQQDGLPLVLTLLPGAGELDLQALVRRSSVNAHFPVPVIPVDGGDTLALYRVAQETIGRARAGGGAAIIEAIECRTDPIALMGSQLLRKGICTERWVGSVEPQLSGLRDSLSP